MSIMSFRLSNDIYHSIPEVKQFVTEYVRKNYSWHPENNRILSERYRGVLSSLVEAALCANGYKTVSYDVNWMILNKYQGRYLLSSKAYYRNGKGSFPVILGSVSLNKLNLSHEVSLDPVFCDLLIQEAEDDVARAHSALEHPLWVKGII